jgi:crotonobetainyl-CoA:carnitine CoA-transferase CaiB-like acyl-CoA transferase
MADRPSAQRTAGTTQFPTTSIAHAAGSPARPGALRGLRIADLTIITAGASATQILADFGADVIKVESARYLDPFRAWGLKLGSEPESKRPWDASPPFNAVNRNKRGISLDLKHPLGREAFLRLVAASDVVAENFRRGVMDRLGLGFETLREVKPDIVVVSLSSQGSTGPESGYGSFGSTLDALSGMMSITGYGPAEPIWSSQDVNYPDQVVSLFGAGAILLGLRHRRRTGQGIYIDVSQRELVTSMIGETVLDYAVNRRVPRPRANRDSSMVPHGVYRCRGEDAWLAIAVENDAQWAALCAVMGRPELAADERYATLPARWQREAEIDALLNTWAGEQDKQPAMAALQAAGVPAGAVLDGRDLLEDPQLRSRKFYQSVVHPVGGAQRQRTWPFHLGRTPADIQRPAPTLGQHTREILTELLGFSGSEIDHLEAEGVIDSEPSSAHQANGAAAVQTPVGEASASTQRQSPQDSATARTEL